MPSGDELLRTVTFFALAVAILGAFIPYKYARVRHSLGAWRTGDGSVGIYAFRKGLVLRSTLCGAGRFLIGALVYSLRSIGVLSGPNYRVCNSGRYSYRGPLFVACTRRSHLSCIERTRLCKPSSLNLDA